MEISKRYYEALDKESRAEYEKILSMPKGSKERLKAEQEYFESANSYNPTDKDASRYAQLSNKILNPRDMSFRNKEFDRIEKQRYEARKNLSKAQDEAHKRLGGDWDFFDSKAFHERMKTVNNDPAVKAGQKKLDSYYDELDRLTLKEIGFTNTKENRKNARYIWQWD